MGWNFVYLFHVLKNSNMTNVTTEEYDLMKDSKYRLYVAAVDKALKNFDYTSEWADLISALGKLNKVLLSYTKFPVIPRRIKISKRLAQCMHPALPSGVHLKALETYDIILRCMGTNRLSCELFIYSAGLFPLMGHAAMNIRPTLLTIYETHFVPLRDRLRPALSGFLNGILPGLDTGSDHFERTNLLLENVCEGVDPTYFYTCVWQCVTNNSLVRLPAISYVLAHFTRKLPMEDQLYLMGHDIGLMVSGICAAVQDSRVLVQRSALDLLVVCFPMQNKQLLYADMVRLVTASLSAILRRDMSLNRRLYSWLLEQEVSNMPLVQIEGNQDQEDQIVITNYQLIAYDLLNDAIKVILKKCSTESPIDVKPYRLLTSLFDKPQIGPIILDNILYDVFRTLYLSCLHHQKYKNSSVRCVSFNGDLSSLDNDENVLNKQFVINNCQDLVKNANLLFNTLQDYYIWSYIEKLFQESATNIKNNKYRNRSQVNDIGSGLPHILEICILTDFLLDIIPIESYAESTSEILPNLFKNIICILKSNINYLNEHEITDSLQLCIKILTKIQPTSPTQLKKTEVDDNELLLNKTFEISSERSLLETKEGGNEEQRTLEKSKSDSKINENLNKFENNDLTVNEISRERSYSNQMLRKKEKYSPRLEKKSKNNMSKSSSKLYDLKKAENNELLIYDTTNKWQETNTKEISSLPERISSTENRYIITCFEEYKNFYVCFIETKVLPEMNINAHFQTFICDKNDRTNQLQKLLDARLYEKPTDVFVPGNKDNSLHKSDIFSASKSPSERIIYEYEKSMHIASNILLEFSAFPNLLENYAQESLPAWIIALVVAACSNGPSTAIQITAMSTLLEVFILANNQILNKPLDCNINVGITGILDLHHFENIKENTVVIEEMAKILWTLLGFVNNQFHLMLCITLLYQIHNAFDSKLFVEQIIGSFLTKENINESYMKQFFLLWNLGRDLNIKLPPNKSNIKHFERCLLRILDNLENKDSPNLQLLVEAFLTHCLLHNDISRIINPILLKLLASNTARVSIRHVHIHNSDTQSDITSQDNSKMVDARAKNAYAISSIDGNIMYHVSHCSSPKPSKKKWFTFSKTGKKFSSSVINMTTSIAEDSNIVTKKNKEFKGCNTYPNLDKGSRDNVTLIINPLGSKEVYPIGLNGLYSKLGSHSSLESLSSATDYLNTSNDNDESLVRTFQHDICEPNGNTDFNCLKNKSQSELIDMISNKKEFATKVQLENMVPNSEDIKSHSAISNTNSGKITKSHSLDEKMNNIKIMNMENSVVQSWSYCISDSANLHCELELSKSADDFFKSKTEEHDVVTSILNDIIDKVCLEIDDADYMSQSLTDSNLKPKMNTHVSKNFCLYPIHSHVCLYYEIFDTNQVFYALQTLKNCILSNPQLFIKSLATSGIQNLKHSKILYLLARHRKSLLGYGFNGELSSDHINFYRGYMFLDVVITICLNYSRSFYPLLDDNSLMTEEINNNIKIQLESLDILDIIVKNLIIMVEKNSKGFLSYIADLLVKCKLQKILLNSLLISVRNFDEDMTFSEEILKFNNFQLYDNKVGESVQAFQVQILRLIHSLIILEHAVFPLKLQTAETSSGTNGEHLNVPVVLIPQQQIFLSAIMSALRHHNTKHIHERWLNMVTSCLPYFGDNLKQICISVILQICTSIEEIANNYRKNEFEELCSDYAVTQLEALTILCHYCLLDSSQTVNQNVPTNTNTPVSNPGEIINNLVNAFFSPLSLDINLSSKQNSDNYQHARKTILSHMPRIISSIAKFWQTIVNLENDYNGVYGNSKVVKQQLLEFLSPISLHHGACFLAAISVTWYERRNLFIKTVLPEPNAGQKNLVLLILAIRVIPLDNLVQTVTAVIKNPPPTEGLSADICLDVCVLELFYCYMRNASATQLSEAWGSLLNLIKEGCSLSPPAQFLVAAILHELMIKCCPLEDRKDQRDLQDVTAKLIDSVSQVCGSCLEQTTWLRKNFAVKEQDEENTPESSIISGSTSEIFINYNHSVQAQMVLSEILAPILDICFGSSEKDKVNGILMSLMCNIVPYLKTHTVRNMPSFNACSKLLSSLSSYQYTRKSWKKEVLELLLDNNLFQMDYSCLKYWKIIVDNLMTHDNITFRDLMNRVSMNQSGGLSIFSSREQEYEQKAQLLKRLAFVIFCSEVDQYAKYMPDIQEQLTSSLRSNVHGIQAQVFLCFRVILIRMGPLHITSLWPIIISEMLQVFLQLEQELSTDADEFSSQMKLISSLDQGWATNSSNHGLQILGNCHWLQLQLSTAKLLDLALLLPTTILPQFQMYRWAFVGDDLIRKDDPHHQISFLPHVVRITDLMDKKYLDTQIDILPMKRNELLLTMKSITHLKDLHSFFKTLSSCSNSHRTDCTKSVLNDYCFTDRQSDRKLNVILEKIDKAIEIDFLDKISK